MKSGKIIDIEQKINESIVNELYEQYFHQKRALEIQNEWFKTDEAKEMNGKDTAKKNIEDNEKTITRLEKELEFFKNFEL